MSNSIKYVASKNYGDDWDEPREKYTETDTYLLTSTIPINSTSTDYGTRTFQALMLAMGTETPYDVVMGVIEPAVPVRPVLSTPIDEADEVDSSSITFTWDRLSETGTSHLQVSESSDFDVVTYSTTTSSALVAVTSLDAGTTYYWRVRIYADDAWSGWSVDTFTFTTAAELDAPILTAPVDEATDQSVTVKCTWGAVSGADVYRVQISKYANMGASVVDTTVGIEEYDTDLDYGTKYYWRVAGIDALDEQGNWSAIWSFTTETTLPTVTTSAATSVKDTTAIANGNMTATGGATITRRGFVYDTVSRGDPGDTDPDNTSYAYIEDETGTFGTGSFAMQLTGLIPETKYYARAFCGNGYSYGDEIEFTTTSTPEPEEATEHVVGRYYAYKVKVTKEEES